MTPLDAAKRKLDELNISDIDRETIRALLYGYWKQWYDAEYYAVAIEQEFALPIINPDARNSARSRTYDYAGKIDLIVEQRNDPGVYYLCDHKTTSEDIEDGGSDFWRRLTLATQPTHYQLALWQMGYKVAGCVWDVIRKPTIRPSKLTKADQKEIADGMYCGLQIESGHDGLEREDAYLYGIRVQADIKANPNKYFQRRPVPRSDHDLESYARELFGLSKMVRESTSSKTFYKTGATHSCDSFGRRCEYLDLCAGFDHETSGNLVQIQVHPELSIEGTNRELLTNSALSTYRQCQKKYEYRYVKGLAKPEREDSSTYFGTAFHAVMEAYWGELLAPQDRQLFQGGIDEHERNGSKSTSEAAVFAGANREA